MMNLFKVILGGLASKIAYDAYVESRKLPQRRIFVSHSWKKASDDYQSFVYKLKKENIPFYNHSIPIYRAFDENRIKKLEDKFRKQMIYCSKIYVLATRGLRKNTYVMTEIKIAKELGKEIIAVKPYGQKGIPNFIRINSTKIIGNDIRSIKESLK